MFVAVTPPESVLDEVEGLVARLRDLRQGGSQVRWTRRAQWHVTLRFLGEVEEQALVVAALAALPRDVPGPVGCRVGPAVEVLGRSVLCLPVAGLDDLAAAVTKATAAIGRPPDARAFRGHLTLARLDRRHPDPTGWVGQPFEARWPVAEVEVVRSRRGRDGSRYEMLHALQLT